MARDLVDLAADGFDWVARAWVEFWSLLPTGSLDAELGSVGISQSEPIDLGPSRVVYFYSYRVPNSSAFEFSSVNGLFGSLFDISFASFSRRMSSEANFI